VGISFWLGNGLLNSGSEGICTLGAGLDTDGKTASVGDDALML
jgi:N-acetyl-anhydromuramyl-L-alanine amidase AmpD